MIKKSKVFDVIKKAPMQSHNTWNVNKNQKNAQKTSANMVAPYMNQEDILSMVRAAPNITKQIVLNRCAEHEQKSDKRCC